MYFAAAFFEGFMVARSSHQQIMMFMFAGVALYLRNTIDDRIAEAEYDYMHGYIDAASDDQGDHLYDAPGNNQLDSFDTLQPR